MKTIKDYILLGNIKERLVFTRLFSLFSLFLNADYISCSYNMSFPIIICGLVMSNLKAKKKQYG